MSEQSQSLRPPAQNWQEVDLHVRYVQTGQARLEGKLDALIALVPKMATTDYIDAKFEKLADEYAPKVQVIALEAQVASIKRELETRTVQSTIDRLGTLALKISGILALIAATVNYLHPFVQGAPK